WTLTGRDGLFLVLHLDDQKAQRCIAGIRAFVPRDWRGQRTKNGSKFLLWLYTGRIFPHYFSSPPRGDKVCWMLVTHMLCPRRKRATEYPYLIVLVKFLTRFFALPLD